MKLLRSTLLAVTTTAICAGSVAAQHAGHLSQPSNAADAVPLEPGQDVFAAISEIVGILSADPETDWSRVDIDALRAHLVDMNALILGAEVEVEATPDGLLMRVSLEGPAGGAASRMIPTHGPVLAAETGWTSEVLNQDQVIQWSVTDPTGRSATKIRSLGFFGLMATGDHHRQHHIALSRGRASH